MEQLKQFDFWFWYYSTSYPDLDLPSEFENLNPSEIFDRLGRATRDQTLTLKISDQSELSIRFFVGTIELQLSFQGQQMLLGWIDGQSCPEVFRLEELRPVLENLSESSFAPPLLLQFLSISSERDLSFARVTLSQSLLSSGILPAPDADIFSRMAFHDDWIPSKWTQQNGYWIPAEMTDSVRAGDGFDHGLFAQFIESCS